jgi:hypothetical protein
VRPAFSQSNRSAYCKQQPSPERPHEPSDSQRPPRKSAAPAWKDGPILDARIRANGQSQTFPIAWLLWNGGTSAGVGAAETLAFAG